LWTRNALLLQLAALAQGKVSIGQKFVQTIGLKQQSLAVREDVACAAQHSTAQHSTAQHSTAQHSTAQHSTAQHSAAQHSTSPAM